MGWLYSEEVKKHFFSPKNVLHERSEKRFKADGIGCVGSPACGDEMKVWIKVKNGKIKECRWRTYGCASAIASTSIMSELVRGMSIEEAEILKPIDLINKLSGLPTRKVHCSVLGTEALKKAIANYKENK